MIEMTGNTPIFTHILNRICELVPKSQAELLRVGAEKVTLETLAYVKFGNYNAWKADGLARTSARLEKRIDEGHEGELAFTLSTMKGRIVDDAIDAVAKWGASLIYPSTPMNTEPGTKAKFNHHTKDRERWIASLGFTHKNAGKGVTRTLFGENFTQLREELEEAWPEQLEGTEPTTSSKGFVNIVGPAATFASKVRYSAGLPDSKAEQLQHDTKVLASWIKLGCDFERTKDGTAVGLGAFYEPLVLQLLAAETQEEPDEKQEEAAA